MYSFEKAGKKNTINTMLKIILETIPDRPKTCFLLFKICTIVKLLSEDIYV